LIKIKTERYDDLLIALTNLVRSHGHSVEKQEFIDAYYRAGVYASEDVLSACYELLSHLEARSSKPPSKSYYKEALKDYKPPSIDYRPLRIEEIAG
jgi:hypothetical protein